jgi:hypothetical protein
MSEYDVSSALRETIEMRFRRKHPVQELYDLRIRIPDELEGRIKTQFMALGWWKVERPAGSKGYIKWWLTDLGKTRLVEILSVRHGDGSPASANTTQRRTRKKGVR